LDLLEVTLILQIGAKVSVFQAMLMLAFNMVTNAGVGMKNPTIRDGNYRRFAQ